MWELKLPMMRTLRHCIGVQTIVYTDISKDGMLAGPNVEQTKILSDKTGIDIIASGGMSCMDDLTHINDAGIHGAIIGKAIYEKRIDLKEAVNLFESGASSILKSEAFKKFNINFFKFPSLSLSK